MGIAIRGVYARRKRLEETRDTNLLVPSGFHYTPSQTPKHLPLTIDNGIVLIGSDSHYFPGDPTVAHRAFVHFCKKLHPKIVIKNGDELDGATISRFQRIGWEQKPSLIQELEVTQKRLDEIYKVSKSAKHIWPLGNHDARFETRLANIAPEYAKIYGVHLKDHFPEWEGCWSTAINDDVIVKHRFKGGIHAPHNNTLWSGKSMITGHLHSLKITPFSDYNGTRFGIDCGTLAEPYGPQFSDYTENNPLNWRSGFVVLTFKDSKLLWPEVVSVYDENRVCFRGELIHV